MIRVPAARAATLALALVLVIMPMEAASEVPEDASIDVQISLCEAPDQVERALELRPRGAPFDVWLFDDPSLKLQAKGLRIRLRETKQGADLTLKVANQDCAKLPRELARAGEGKCEYDQHGTNVAGTLSLEHNIDPHTAGELVAGRIALARALGATQKRFLQSGAGVWPLPSNIRALGPAHVRSYRAKGKPYVVDVSELPGGERFIEISHKGRLADSARIRVELEADLARAGIAICADQSAQAVNKLRALLRRP